MLVKARVTEAVVVVIVPQVGNNVMFQPAVGGPYTLIAHVSMRGGAVSRRACIVGPGEGLPRVRRSRPLVRSGLLSLLGRGFVAASVLCLGALCGFAVLVLSAPARAILSRSGLGAAYGPSRGKPQMYF